jgi:hypothetical protein
VKKLQSKAWLEAIERYKAQTPSTHHENCQHEACIALRPLAQQKLREAKLKYGFLIDAGKES